MSNNCRDCVNYDKKLEKCKVDGTHKMKINGCSKNFKLKEASK